MKKTFILAENYSQAFFYFAHKMKSLEYIYIQSPTQLQGLGSVEIKIIKVGTWHNRNSKELNEIHFLLISYGHEGILMPKSWYPDEDILNKLDKLIHKSSYFENYHEEAERLREIYIKYGYIQKRRANEIYTYCLEREKFMELYE